MPWAPDGSNPQSPIPNPLIADVGTGSGIIAVCLAKHLSACRMTAIDLSPAALAVARDNATRHGVADRIEFWKAICWLPFGRAAIRLYREQSAVCGRGGVRETGPRRAKVRTHARCGRTARHGSDRTIDLAGGRPSPAGRTLLMEISPTVHAAAGGLLEADGRFELGQRSKTSPDCRAWCRRKRRGKRQPDAENIVSRNGDMP